MGAETVAALRAGLPPEELERLLNVGATMSGSELFALAVRP